MELNLANEKYAIFLILEGLDFFLKHQNICILDDFNATPSNPRLTLFLENQNLKNLIENPRCFKSSNGSTIDLILTNNSFSIKKVSHLKQEVMIAT